MNERITTIEEFEKAFGKFGNQFRIGFVVRNKCGGFLTSRRATDEMYVSRAQLSPDIEQARIFKTESAAVNSANQSNVIEDGYEVLEVTGELKNV